MPILISTVWYPEGTYRIMGEVILRKRERDYELFRSALNGRTKRKIQSTINKVLSRSTEDEKNFLKNRAKPIKSR